MKVFKPRRGKRSTAISKSIVLQDGEIFFEVPSEGVGKGKGKIIMGDGIRSYEDLPVFLASYGMEVRENFEKRLASFNSEVIDYINNFNDELSTLVCGAKGKSIKEIANKLHENVRHNASIDAADKANDTIASWFNGNMNYYYFIDQEIHWAQSMMKSTKINHMKYQ